MLFTSSFEVHHKAGFLCIYIKRNKFMPRQAAEWSGKMMQNGKPMEKQSHVITLENRANMTLTGVSEVVNFSETAVELITNMGGLTVKGKSLNISRLNTDTGELSVNGDIHSMQYTNVKKKTSLLEGLFK